MFKSTLHFKKNRISLLFHICGGIAIILALGSCGFKKIKNGNKSEDLIEVQIARINSRTIGFEQIKSKILTQNCLACHSGRKEPNLSTYAGVKSALSEIENTVNRKKTMPKKGPLSISLQAYLQAWINNGAPEIASESEGDQPATPEVIIRPVTFSVIKAKVFQTNCNSCHSIGNHAENQEPLTELETYKSTMSVKEWLDPIIFGGEGDVSVPVEDRMPPPNTPQLTNDQKSLLKMWFEDGYLE